VNVLDLFSGIGGFSLGLERAGMRTAAFCEIEPYARAVLRKHWPNVPCYDDVRTLTSERLRADGIVCDVICGGFPCQDISSAGRGAGIDGERSGLWSEYARIIGEVRPRYVIVENVAILLARGLDRVLGDLALIGYDAEWDCIPASAVGAFHRRDRIWIIAYPNGFLHERGLDSGENILASTGSESGDPGEGKTLHRERLWDEARASSESLAHANCSERWADNPSCGSVQRQDGLPQGKESPSRFEPGCEAMADAERIAERPRLCENEAGEIRWRRFGDGGCEGHVPQPESDGCGQGWQRRPNPSCERQRESVRSFQDAPHYASISEGIRRGDAAGQWWIEPGVGRVAHGVSNRVDRLKGLGNAVVPQIPQIIGEAIMAHEATK
jgi:site-specific DNA-cytosine methylase